MIRPPTEYLRKAEFKTIVAFLGLGLWFSSLVAPVYLADPIGLVGMDDPSPDRPFGGWLLLVLGFVGPIGFAPGWYANLAFGVALYRRFRDRPVKRFVAITGLLLCLSALGPFRFYDWESGTVIWYFLRGPAVWLWLVAEALVFLPGIWDE